ncbi:hypothetical protein GYH30_037365 [Glycine max]|nr:hypothetical protein GYH30_037365 [Glycine max]
MHIYARAAAKGKRVQVDALSFLLPLAKLLLTAHGFGAAGQRCMALSTVVFVGGSKLWESKLLEHVKALKVNVGTKPDADLGPVISKQAKERIHKLIQSGVESGARLMLDGRNIVADSLEEAINIINENKYGNGASIFTTSSVAARKFQAEIEAGQVGINVSSSFALFLIYWQQGLICWRSQFLRSELEFKTRKMTKYQEGD